MIIIDTTPIVAFFDARDSYHGWAKTQFQSLDFPFNTCDAVITEALHLLSRAGAPIDPLFELLEKRFIRVIYHIQYSEICEIRALMTKYRDTPMDLADACLIRMSELHSRAGVFTIDSDFHIYRRNRDEHIPLIIPR